MAEHAPVNASGSVVWLADDDAAIRFVLSEALRDTGAMVRDFADADALLAAFDDDAPPDVIVSDVRMPGASGLELLQRLRDQGATTPVIMMSAFTDVASTAAAYRNGAFDYLPKPFDLDHAVAAVLRALAQTPAPASLPAPVGEIELIGNSPPMREVFRSIGRVAVSDLNVLITGPTGTGKELVARALHRHSARASRPFVALNTAAIPAELLESELFGHEAGAFTGALKRGIGRFEQAHGGTLFLDEIGDMPLSLQTRLLRVLAEKEFYRVGGRELIRADVRVVAATHQDLDAKAASGEFRADLLHRLDVVRLRLPPLAERSEDVPLLAEYFVARAAQAMRSEPKRLTASALAALARMPWPGNVRQLENLCRRLVVMTPGREIRAQDLPSDIALGDAPGSGWRQDLLRITRARLARGERDVYAALRTEFDAILIDAALAENDGRRVRAAEQLGLGRNTLTRKVGASRRRAKSKTIK